MTLLEVPLKKKFLAQGSTENGSGPRLIFVSLHWCLEQE